MLTSVSERCLTFLYDRETRKILQSDTYRFNEVSKKSLEIALEIASFFVHNHL
jgi:hypothetical protein